AAGSAVRRSSPAAPNLPHRRVPSVDTTHPLASASLVGTTPPLRRAGPVDGSSGNLGYSSTSLPDDAASTHYPGSHVRPDPPGRGEEREVRDAMGAETLTRPDTSETDPERPV